MVSTALDKKAFDISWLHLVFFFGIPYFDKMVISMNLSETFMTHLVDTLFFKFLTTSIHRLI